MITKRKIEIEREFLEDLLEDEIELFNLAIGRRKERIARMYQHTIDKIKILLKED